MNQGEVLSRTWKLLWKHKVLYLLGLVSSLVLVDLNALLIMLVCISPSEFNRWDNSILSVSNSFISPLKV
ncbi:MAG TPA: hypothetical protein PLT26_11785 [Anaerolineaceae bacterium]|jgi:hypothetical protein|nr:hypothetical protein [Anaerolineaceae bacterium]HQH86184.1 hypothetical protein [Anaerolineaceae bacterium]